MNKYYIDYYDSWDMYKLGIFYNGQNITYCEVDDKIKTYSFILQLNGFSYNDDPLNRFFNYNSSKEYIKFACEVNLKSLYKKDGLPNKNKLQNFIKKQYPEIYKKAQQRLDKKINKIIPNKILYNGDYYNGEIFLEFEKECAFNWGGPFEMNNKLGAIAILKEYEFKGYPIFDITTCYSYYNIPQEIAKENNLSDKIVYNWDDDTKRKFFNSLPIWAQHKIFKERLGWYCSAETIENYLPYKIYLSGNDDTSYSKWFATKEEANKELDYLLMMQPLDMVMDIYDRGYIFTN